MRKENIAVEFDRVSSDDQRDGFSLEAQRELSSRYAKEKKLKIVKRWAASESASKEDDRKKFFEMVEYVKENRIENVIFDKVDRACRGLKSGAMIAELIDKYDVKFHFPREALVVDKYSPPQEKLRLDLGIILAKYYVDNLKVEIKKGLDTRIEKGHWNSKAPFGYKNVRIGPSQKAVVVPDEETASIAKECFELYSTGNYSFVELGIYISTKLGRRVSKGLPEDMIPNPFYYGDRMIKGKLIKGGVHEPLVDKKLWLACQKIRGIRARERGKKKNVIPKPFMGMLKCGNCGHQVTGEAKRKSSGKTYIYYHCANTACVEKSKHVSQDKLFEQLLQAFEPFARFTPKATEAFIAGIHERLKDLDDYTSTKSRQLSEKRTAVKEYIELLDDFNANGKLPKSDYKELKAMKELELEDIKIELSAYNEADHNTFKEGLRIIELFVNIWNYMKMEGNELEKIRLGRLVLSNLTLQNRSIEYLYQKPFDDLIELAGQKVWWTRSEST